MAGEEWRAMAGEREEAAQKKAGRGEWSQRAAMDRDWSPATTMRWD